MRLNHIDVIRWEEKGKPTLEGLTQRLEAKGLRSELFSDPPGTKYGRHAHEWNDFVVIVSGQMTIGIGDEFWVMKPGDRLDIPKNTFHWAKVTGRKDVVYLSAKID